MEWQLVRLKEHSGRSYPFVTIGRGQLQFNAVACQLVGDEGQYKFAQLFKGKDNGKTVIGVKFLEDYEEEAIAIKRKKDKDGNEIKGITIASKGIIEELFGKDGSNDGAKRRKVELDENNILKIID